MKKAAPPQSRAQKPHKTTRGSQTKLGYCHEGGPKAMVPKKAPQPKGYR